MAPFIQLGVVRIYTFGLMMGLSFCVAYWLGEVYIRRHNMRLSMSFMLPAILTAGLIGSKLDGFLVLDGLLHHRRLADMSWSGFISTDYIFFGGLICGTLVTLAILHARGIPLAEALDAAPIVAICYGIGRIGCLLAGDGDYGIPTSLPWGMTFPHGIVPTLVPVHPNPIYQTIYAGVIFLVLWPQSIAKDYPRRPPGSIGVDTFLWMGICRFATEFISRNHKFFAGLTEAQWVSVVLIIGMLVLRPQLDRPSRSRQVSNHAPSMTHSA
jgi:phosphatidylglycerol:prolipoprotein diacylglycerol transferase